ncbi:glycosyl hydrolase family 61-domain-containing protein [Trametes polyzona]|nr:glycosyl hydrolase family 61-domain-containing protein [Trametes polyzona]
MMKRAAVFAAISAAVPFVAAHGFVSLVAIDGKQYPGNVPNNYKGPSPIRLVSDISPVKGASNPDLNCGLNAQLAELVVPANPGSTVEFQWSGGAGQKWPHNTGPLMTYLASCGSTTCDKFDSKNAQWFKIDEAGKKKNDPSQWVQQDIMNGDSYSLTLPEDLAPGDYLIRHEIIALHLAVSKGGAEFYPSCTQIRVGGNGNGKPTDTVKFPGGYSDSDPGIFDPSVFDSGAKYVFPGPPISNLASESAEITPPATETASFPPKGASATGSSSTAAAASPSASGVSGAAASKGGKSQCKLKSAKNATASASASVNRPRHYSRVMRRIMHSS